MKYNIFFLINILLCFGYLYLASIIMDLNILPELSHSIHFNRLVTYSVIPFHLSLFLYMIISHFVKGKIIKLCPFLLYLGFWVSYYAIAPYHMIIIVFIGFFLYLFYLICINSFGSYDDAQ